MLSNDEESQLYEYTAALTNLKLYLPIANIEISDENLKEQLKIFLKRSHSFILKAGENLDSRALLVDFMRKPDLCESIPDVMTCVVTCFLLGHNESYVESMGSKLKYHNPEKRNITITHLEDEMTVAWNGPSIPHSDGLIKEAIDCMHGAGHWHFYRESVALSSLKYLKLLTHYLTLSRPCPDNCPWAHMRTHFLTHSRGKN